MSTFNERLEALGAKRLGVSGELARERWAIEKPRRKLIAYELKKLEKRAKRRLRPLVEAVNEVYLNSAGKFVYESSSEKCSRNVGFKEIPDARLEAGFKLSWDERRTFYPNLRGGKRLTLKLELESLLAAVPTVKAFGAGKNSPKVEVSINAKGWREEVEEGIYSILTTPDACDWIERISKTGVSP